MLNSGTDRRNIMSVNKIALDADSVLKEIEVLSRKKFLPIIGPIKGKYLINTVRKYHVSQVLEIGTLVGYSAILIAENLPDNGKIISIEINPLSANQAQDNIQKAGLSGKIEVRVGNALNEISRVDNMFDMLFIDAAKDEYFEYLKLGEAKLKKNGVVFADNVKIFASQMPEYLDYVRNSGKYQSKYVDVGFDGVEISLKLF
jgi:predicted O-methyltransferase YrrM